MTPAWALAAPVLAQRDTSGNWFADLLPVILLVLFTTLPSIAQARRKARERAAGRPGGPTGGSGAAPPPKPKAEAAGDLEDRVRRYFEEMVGGPAKPSPRPAPAAPPSPPPVPRPEFRPTAPPAPPVRGTPARTAAQFGAATAGLSDAHIDLASFRPRHFGGAQFRRRPAGATARRREAGDPTRRRPRLRLKGADLRNAIVLRELLGPPKALEEGGPR